MFYTDTSAKPVLTFKENSITDINVKNGLFYASGRDAHIASSCTLKSRSNVQSRFSSQKQRSHVQMRRQFFSGSRKFFSASLSVCRFGSRSCILPISHPLHFSRRNTLYCIITAVRCFRCKAAQQLNRTLLNFSAQQINTWNTAKTPYSSAGDFSDKPTHSFYKLIIRPTLP